MLLCSRETAAGARASLRAYPEGYARFMCAPVYTLKFIRAVYTRCQRYFSIWKASPDLLRRRLSIATSAIFVLQKKILKTKTANHWLGQRLLTTAVIDRRLLMFFLFLTLRRYTDLTCILWIQFKSFKIFTPDKCARIRKFDYEFCFRGSFPYRLFIEEWNGLFKSILPWNNVVFKRDIKQRCWYPMEIIFLGEKLKNYRRVLTEIYFFVSSVSYTYLTLSSYLTLWGSYSLTST